MGEDKEFNYDALRFFDVIGPIEHLIRRGTYWINQDGLIEAKMQISAESPWLFAKQEEERQCRFWAQIIFQHYDFIPKGCYNCWKVVGHPENFDQAVQVFRFQKKLNLPSKTGMEQRDYTGHYGGWSSFWYCPYACGLDGAREYFEKIKKALKDEFGSYALKVRLKRACTEMEQKVGPTDQWQYQMAHHIKEQAIKAAWVHIGNPIVPALAEVNTKRRWIEWAAGHGDDSYLKYGNEKILRSAVFYDESIHSAKDFQPILEEERREANGDDRNSGYECEKCEGSCKGCADNDPTEGIVLV